MIEKKNYFHCFSVCFVLLGSLISAQATSAGLAEDLSGRILLQVESHGEAWYVDPQTFKRSYLGRPHDAFTLMRELGLGISDKDLQTVPLSGLTQQPVSSLAQRLKGRILLQVESKGEAWYVNPLDGTRHFMGRPADAFALMRSLGLGVSNSNLEHIAIERDQPVEPITINQQSDERITVYDQRVAFRSGDSRISENTESLPPPAAQMPLRPEVSHSVIVVGDENCQHQTQRALDLLFYEARDYYDFTVLYLGVIECTPSKSGVYVWDTPARFEAGEPTRNAGDIWYASVLAHESCHVWQYRRHEMLPVPYETYAGAEAEQECTALQKNAAVELNAPESTIHHLHTILDAKWWDIEYQNRWW